MRQAKLYFFILWFHTKFLSRSTVNMIERLKLLSIFKYKKGDYTPPPPPPIPLRLETKTIKIINKQPL